MSASSLTVEQCRQFWAVIANENGRYEEPFFVQVWVDGNGDITDSVSFDALDRDIVVEDNE